MANPEHVEVVRKGAKAIEEWRRKHPKQVLDLSKATLFDINLVGANLSKADLSHAILGRIILVDCDLSNATLTDARFSVANLEWTKFVCANLSKATFFGARFLGNDLSEANLSGAFLINSTLWTVELSNVDLTKARIVTTEVQSAKLNKADFTEAGMIFATLSDCDLSQCVGLDTVIHGGPNSIGVDTLTRCFRNAGNQFTSEMETFFLNAGVPEELLDALPKILAEVKYCSCFVCYGQPDLGFAEKLVEDLKAKGVSCWLYSLDFTPGKRTWGEITERRREAEKMIVLCSMKSLIRDGVKKEIEEQIDEERDKIVPISLDDDWKTEGFEVKRGQRDLKTFLLERNYADFCEESKYDESLERLLKGIERT